MFPEVSNNLLLGAVRSQGGSPVLGSEEVKLPTWKSGPLLQCFALLAGFAQGNIQMKGNAVKHMQEGNTARLKQVTIELMIILVM